MIQSYANYDIGFIEPDHNVNEDFARVKLFNHPQGDIFFAVVADGAGSNGTQYQPAILAAVQIEEAVERLCRKYPAEFLSSPHVFLEEAMTSASNSLQSFKIADEQHYNGFATSLSCVVIHNNRFSFAHTGNTRIHLIRNGNIKQLTVDQTRGMQDVNDGKISFTEYHLHRSRLEILGGLGLSATPKIQTFSSVFKENDIMLLTSDGIHCALRPDAMLEILSKCNTCEDSVESLIKCAKMEKYPDNMSAVLIWNMPEGKDNGNDSQN